MQTDQVQKIKDKVTASQAKLLSAMAGFDEAAWDWQPDEDRWSARLTLAHVGAAQWSHLEVARRLLAGELAEIPGFDLDAWNAAAVAKRADWPVGQILADLEAGHQATLALLDELEAEALAITGAHPALGQMSVGQVLRVIGLHAGLHRRDILSLSKEWQDREGRKEEH